MELTDKEVAKLTLKGKSERQIADDLLPGLRLRLRKGRKGTNKSWIYKYRDPAGRDRVFTVNGMSVTQARKWAGALQAKRRLGQDPAQERDAGHALSAETFGAVLKPYLTAKATSVRPKSRKEIERYLLVGFKPLHRLPLASISTAILSSRLLAIENESGRTSAEAARRSVHAFLAWAMRHGMIDRNPAMGVERRKVQARARVLAADELKAIWEATGDGSDYSVIIRILLLLGLRANEIGSLRWGEVLSDRIVLPGTRTKNGREHTIPLTPQVAAMLASRVRSGDFVFGKVQHSGFSGWSRGKRALDASTGIAKAWTTHDLRRTAATGMAELGIAPHIIEAALNHAGARTGVAAVYNRAGYEGAIRHALAVWETHVGEIVTGKVSGDRVVPLRA